MAIYTVRLQNVTGQDVISLTDGTTYATLEVNPSRGPKGDGWTGVTYSTSTGRFTFTSNDGLGYVSDDITVDLDAAVAAAQAAQSGAEAAEAATELLFDQFGDQYLGPKASDPTVDNDGNPLVEGAIYFNTTDDVLKFYSGTAWVAPESIATTAATAAQASATAAAASETNAAASESAAATSETNAAASAAAAAASYDDFDDRYLGAKSSDPTVDNDGNALITGALYFNTTDGQMKVYNGSSWQAAALNPSSFVAVTGDTMTGDLSFGDNDKAIFGAGSDLQIFHDGTNSYIRDLATGNLIIDTNGSTIDLKGSSPTEYMARFIKDGAVTLYYDNASKFATTATGVDVTGTVTADGLTVDGASQFNTGASGIAEFYHSSGYGGVKVTGAATGSGATVYLSNDKFGTPFDIYTLFADGADDSFKLYSGGNASSGTLRFKSANNGDISFYEDTGTTPRFFWDASAEALGIGTSSPSAVIHATNSGSSSESLALFEAASTRNGYFYINGDDNRRKSLVFQSGGVDKFSMGVGDSDELSASSFFIGSGKTGGSGADLVIDSSGNVLVGGTSLSTAYVSLRGGDNNCITTFRISTGTRDHIVFTNGVLGSATTVGKITTSGSSTSYLTSSDYRLKENVVALDDAADRLAQIPVHRFNFIADPDTTVDGFLAHEVQAIVPEAVTGEKDAVDADGNPVYQGIDQSKLVPLLAAALQEALTEIENLKARVATLEGA